MRGGEDLRSPECHAKGLPISHKDPCGAGQGLTRAEGPLGGEEGQRVYEVNLEFQVRGRKQVLDAGCLLVGFGAGTGR